MIFIRVSTALLLALFACLLLPVWGALSIPAYAVKWLGMWLLTTATKIAPDDSLALGHKPGSNDPSRN